MGTFPRGIAVEHRTLRRRADRLLVKVTTEAQPKNPKWASKLPGDTLALRGIPAIGLGVEGAITGTRP